MDTSALKEEFYLCIKEALKEFSKSSDNKEVYAIVLDCDSSVGMAWLRYGNKEHFQEELEEYKNYNKKYGWEIYGLHGSEYEPGEFSYIEYQESGTAKHFTESYYYYATGHDYYEREPIEDIKDNYEEIFWDMILDTCRRLKKDIKEIGIDITEDFIVFYCDHDQSEEERDQMIRMTVEEEIMEKLINKKSSF